ncbi:MAG TPA: hypothetical protein PKM25_14830 [Candidatus Ozemobacteraceae bacterium]|nr:hypothetical protein [Candidatus Ozemobacteraceae bacterium]
MMKTASTVARTACSVCLLSLVLFVLSGCDNSSGPSSSDLSSGQGFKIQIGVSNRTLANGGSIHVWASVSDDAGRPVTDDTVQVLFSAGEKGITWTDKDSGKEDLVNGVATAILEWVDPSSGDSAEPNRTCLVTASYKGAVAQIEIVLVANGF